MSVEQGIAQRVVVVAVLCTAVSASAVLLGGAILGAAIALAMVVVAAIVSHYWVARPLALKLDRLAQFARELGSGKDEQHSDILSGELGNVSVALTDAHRRAQETERLLRTQYQALRLQQVNIAHDLRTPLTTLLLALESARDAALAGEDPGVSIRAAMSEALYLTSLVQNFRIASRMDAGFETLGERRELDLVEVIQRVATRFTLLAKGSKTSVEFAHPDDPVMVYGDATMIEQMVTNLVQNSLAYGGADQMVVIVLSQSDVGFVIEVLDEGPGIEPAALSAITQRWVRGASGKGRRKSGQGLGLAIVSEVAAVHGWKLSLSNREEGGLSARIEGKTLRASHPPAA